MLIAIQDEASARITSSLQSALLRVGAKMPVNPGYRGSFALIGYTGPERPSWIAQERNVRRQGPSVLNKTIFYYGPVVTQPSTTPQPSSTPGTRPPVGKKLFVLV